MKNKNEEKAEYDKKRYQSKKDELAEKHRAYGATIQGHYNHFKSGAMHRVWEMGLSFTDYALLVSSPCVYCGKIQENFNGVDRVDNNEGYTLKNSVSCCKFCNIAKNILSVDEFLGNVEEIHNWQTENYIKANKGEK